MKQDQLTYYIDQYTTGKISPEELNVLRKLLQEPANRAALEQRMQEDWEQWEQSDVDFSDVTARVEELLQQRIAAAPPVATPVHRVHFLRRWGWAAAVLLIAGAAAVGVVLSDYEEPVPETVAAAPDIMPAGNKALLTLADGTVIALDSATNGMIAQQGNAAVVKLANGELRYNTSGTALNEELLNTMTTPRGGQYQLVLPDGSRVWLNAASSVTYPAAFVGKERKISVTGEAYLEVAPDKSRPFFVDIDGEAKVQVLGTSFNINAYKDDNNIKTTLVEGAIKVSDEVVAAGSVLLSPSQQAVLQTGTSRSLELVKDADLAKVLAWKNGLFNLNGTGFVNVMKELERWYDVDVQYEGTPPSMTFGGKMDRNVKLSGIIRFMKDYKIEAQLKGRTLIIKGS